MRYKRNVLYGLYALACAIAFGELKNCDIVLPGKFNSTISNSIRKWDLNFSEKFLYDYKKFVLVDASNPKYFPSNVSHEKIKKVFDHHFGFENYWETSEQIEFVGACATLIFELFKDKAPSSVTANLLCTARIV